MFLNERQAAIIDLLIEREPIRNDFGWWIASNFQSYGYQKISETEPDYKPLISGGFVKVNESNLGVSATDLGKRALNLRKVLKATHDLIKEFEGIGAAPGSNGVAEKLDDMPLYLVNNFLQDLEKMGYVEFFDSIRKYFEDSGDVILPLKRVTILGKTALNNPDSLAPQKQQPVMNSFTKVEARDINTNQGSGNINTGAGIFSRSSDSIKEKGQANFLEGIRPYVLLLAAFIGLIASSITLISVLLQK